MLRVLVVDDHVDTTGSLAMIQGAALGIAMGNAVPSVRDAADVVTEGHGADGVARAIDRILDGEW